MEASKQPAVKPEALAEQPAAEEGGQEGSKAGKKRKVAMYLAYVGHGFQGMQRNPGARTIEDELFRALHQAGAISDANADENGFIKIHWMRAARTDKGVSAVGQVVSFKMVMDPEGMLERINANLPGQIRVFGYSRVTNGFDSRKHCDKRRYEYVLPEWAFDPRRGQGRAAGVRASAAAAAEEAAAAAAEEGAQQDGAAAGEQGGAEQQDDQQAEEQQTAAGAGQTQVAAAPPEQAEAEVAAGAAGAAAASPAAGEAAGGEQPGSTATAEAGTADGAAKGDGAGAAAGAPTPAAGEGGAFVFDDACTQRLTQILSIYEGTHNFHNFTVRKAASAPDAKRYILSFRCKGVFEISGERWVKMVVVGQSFMLHQIRKMVGMAVAVMRGTASEECMRLALKTSADLNTPMAPELGLFLDECFFDAYNSQWGEMHSELKLSDYQAEVDAFKAQHLYPHIAARDGEEGVNEAWLRTLNEANYRFRQWEQQVKAIRHGGGRRPAAPKGAGAASLIGGMETYGQDDHKRRHSGGGRGGRGQPPAKKARGDFVGGRRGRIEQRVAAASAAAPAGAGQQAAMAAGEYSD
ncbi:hypothetical protein ABPG75_001782 [Micractinium tetrahymenae]